MRRPCSVVTAVPTPGLAERAAERFRAEFVTPAGRVAFPAQTAYALALQFDLLEPGQREHAQQLLTEQVAADGWHIGTGFLGTPLVTDALADAGEIASAYELLLQRENPSWLYPVTMGATTIWERWDSMLPDGSINPGEMTSFNHYAYGAVADWLHRTVAGLAPAEPAYRRLRIAPRPGPGISSAAATHETPYGRAEVSWTLDGSSFALEVTVPPNTSAEVSLPDGSAPVEVGSGRHTFERTVVPMAPVEKPQVFDWHPEDVTMSVDTEAGPPPPYDPECGAVLATLPSFPPLTLDSIPAMRAGAAAYMPRPTNEELARGGAYSVEERTVPGPPGAPDVALIICRPAAPPARCPRCTTRTAAG